MATMHPCTPSELTTYQTPWKKNKDEYCVVTINKALLPKFKRACEKAHSKNKWRKRLGRSTYYPRRVDSYNCRKIRGSSAWSRHASGAAFDFFNKPYPEPVDVWGNTNSPPEWFANCFKKEGFTWGGDWTGRPDFPHIEWSSSVV